MPFFSSDPFIERLQQCAGGPWTLFEAQQHGVTAPSPVSCRSCYRHNLVSRFSSKRVSSPVAALFCRKQCATSLDTRSSDEASAAPITTVASECPGVMCVLADCA